MFLTSPNLGSLPHGFFTRAGGASEGIYASLNCGPGSGDGMAHVTENRARVAAKLGATGPQLLSLYQVHGDKVMTVDKPWAMDARPQADAMVTAMPGIALGILTADCVPVLLADKERGVIGAAHAGWKGALAGVLGRTIEAMRALGAENIHAAIGPCIGQASYEVGRDMHDQFTAQDLGTARCFNPAARTGHFFFDLRGYVHGILSTADLNSINTLENDTYVEEDSFFSFRRATHREESGYGRQISAIMLK